MKTYLFVYGTLMSGERRHHLLRWFGKYVKDAVIHGFRLYHNSEGDYPVLRETDDVSDIVVGELWELNGDSHDQLSTLSFLDDMEGGPVLYSRMTVTLDLDVKAFVYCGNWETWKNELDETDLLPSGVRWSSQNVNLS